MRLLNYKERKIIKAIANILEDMREDFSFFLRKNFFNEENQMGILFLPKENMAILYVTDIESFYLKIRDLLEFISLIEYLKDQRYTYHTSIIPNQTLGKTLIHQHIPVAFQI